MASFKKIRLDPDAPPNHRNVSNQPGANDTGGRSFLDGSSFSSSTSGGSGAYRRSTGPFRTRYSQPMGTPSPSSNSFSRFAPYYFGRERRTSLRVPLIRARRDDSDSEGNRPSSRASLNSSLGGDSTTSATSSTAQRIIETLQNLSTPVMNAGKIRIDQDIKAVQPLPFGGGTPLSRMSPGGSLNRSTGPPKMCSSLLLSNPSPSNQINPLFNSGDQRRLFCIPRMVDVSTNTDKEEVSPSSQMHFASKSSTPTKSPVVGSTAMKPVVSTISSKDDNTSEEEYHECSSGFTFSNPWAPDTFNRYLFSPNEDKSISKGTAGTQQPMINGYKETVPTSLPNQMFSLKNAPSFPTSVGSSPSLTMSSPMKPIVSQSSAGGFGGFQGGITKGFGAPPLKDNTPLGKSGSSMSSEIKTNTPTMFGSGKIENNSSGKTIEINKSSSGTLPSFNFGDKSSSGQSSSSPQPQKTFSFGGTSTSNDTKSSLSVDKVDAAKSENSTVSKSPLTSGTESKSPFRPLRTLKEPKWRCSTCMVENDLAALNCVCCKEQNPNVVNTDTEKPATKNASKSKQKWRCPTCAVENEPTAASCVCCSEKNPNPVSAPARAPATTASAGKTWSCPTCMVANSATAAECVCCSEKNPNPIITDNKKSSAAAGSAPAPTFKFGISSSNPVTSSTSVSSSTGSFVFGASKPAQSDISNASTSFKFGAPATTSNPPAISRPSNPTVTSTSSQPTTTAVSTPQFSFGSNVSSSSTLPAVAERPSFGFPVPVSTNSQAATTANTTTTPSSNLFSAPKVSESNSVSSASAGGGSLFGSTNFQSPQTAPTGSFNFSGTPATTSEAPKPTGPSFSFASSAGSKPAFGGNSSFGSSQQNQGSVQSGSTPSILSSAPAPAPSFSFGSSNPAAPNSPFGAPIQFNSNPPSQSSGGGMFPMSGPMAARPLPPGPGASPVPTFSLTPNLNFGVTPGSTIPFGNPTQTTPNAGSQAPAPPALFQFGAPPTAAESPGGRKIKRAVRRFKN